MKEEKKNEIETAKTKRDTGRLFFDFGKWWKHFKPAIMEAAPLPADEEHTTLAAIEVIATLPAVVPAPLPAEESTTLAAVESVVVEAVDSATLMLDEPAPLPAEESAPLPAVETEAAIAFEPVAAVEYFL